MTTAQIYQKHGTPKNLQEHMLRVSTLAKIITDHWTGQPINQPSIIQTCLFHDIAKPITFDMAKQAQYVKSAIELEALRQVHDSLITHYGKDEHQAAIKILQEIGCSSDSIKLINDLEWIYLPRLLRDRNYEALITIYCDMRIGPNGILSMSDRIANLQTRKQVEGFNIIVKSGQELEQLIIKNLNLNPNSITDKEINKIIPQIIDS